MLALMPHISCFLGDAALATLHLLSDLAIAVAYFWIPAQFGTAIYRGLKSNRWRDLDQTWKIYGITLMGLSAFILFCGVSHAINAWNIFHANYWLEGVWKALAATVSLWFAANLAQHTTLISRIVLQAARSQQTAVLLQAICDSALDGIMAFQAVRDQDGRIIDFRWVYSNGKELGPDLAGEDLTGQRLLERLPSHLANGLFEKYCHAVESHSGGQLQFGYFCKEEGIEDHYQNAYSFLPPDGFVVVFRRITQFIQAQKALEEKNRVLEAKRNELLQVGDIFSHDLKAPLRNLASLMALIFPEAEAEKLPEEDLAEFVEDTKHQIQRLHQQVESIARWNRIDRGQMTCIQMELQPLIEGVINAMQSDVRLHNPIVQFGKLPVVWGVLSQIEQLFQNLIQNSLQAADSNRRLKLSFYSTQGEGNFAYIFVQDNGIGFDSRKYGDLIFKPGQRLDAHNEDGTGMGLAICKKVVEAHCGEIQVESASGQGAKFRLKLPIVKEHAAS